MDISIKDQVKAIAEEDGHSFIRLTKVIEETLHERGYVDYLADDGEYCLWIDDGVVS